MSTTPRSPFREAMTNINAAASRAALKLAVETLNDLEGASDETDRKLAKMRADILEVETGLQRLRIEQENLMSEKERLKGEIEQVNFTISNTSYSLTGQAPRGTIDEIEVKRRMAEQATVYEANANRAAATQRPTEDFTGSAPVA